MEQMISQLKEKAAKVIEALKADLTAVRTGRANPTLIENVKAEAYGQMMTIKELGMISAPDPKILTVQAWDATNVQAIIKGIRDSGLGLNPVEDSGVIRVPLPQITQERRTELVKLVNTKSEEKRVQIRNLRREMMEGIDKDEKAGAIGEDEKRRAQEQIQKEIDSVMSQIDLLAKTKEAELQEI